MHGHPQPENDTRPFYQRGSGGILKFSTSIGERIDTTAMKESDSTKF
jgi:hypothetical protein